VSNSTNLRADLQINGVWTNITDHTYTKEAVTIRRGRTDEASSPQAATLDIALNNRDGRFTPTNPAGAYYPNLNRQTPIRLGMGTPPAGAGANSTTASTSMVAPGVTAETAGIVFSYWAQHTPTASFTAPSGYTSGSQRNGLFSGARDGYKVVSAGAIPTATMTSNQSQPWAAATTFLPIPVSGTVASTQSAAGMYSASSLLPNQLQIAFTPVTLAAGDVLLVANAWSGDFANSMCTAPQDNSGGCSWVLVSDSGFQGNAAPRILMWAFYSDSAQTVTVTMPNHYNYIDDNIAVMWQVTGVSEWNSRFAGQCATFNTTADLSGVDVRTQLEAGSVLRQRGQGQETPRSALYRYYAKSQAVAYWPLEGLVANAITSPLANQQQAQVIGTAGTFDNQSGVPGSDNLVTLNPNSYVQAQLPALSAGANQPGAMSCVFELPTAYTGGASPSLLSATFIANGSADTFLTVQWITGNATFNVVAYTSAGASTTLLSGVGPPLPGGIGGSNYLGRPIFMNIAWAPNAANPTTQLDCYGLFGDMETGTYNSYLTTGNAVTLSQAQTLFFGTTPFPQTYFNVPIAVGHMTYTNSARTDGTNVAINAVHQTPSAYFGVMQAWGQEDLIARMTRITQEQSINFQSRPPSTALQAITLGQQDLNDTITLLEECQESDGEGELFEARGFPGLTYRSVGEISGAPAQATLNYTGKQIADPFQNVDDDQLTRNDITVQQVNGSSQRVYQATGPLNNQPPPVGVGTFTGNPTVNVWNQSRDLPALAQWALHVGTTNAPRYAAIATKLPASPSTISAVSSLDCGQRFTVTNPPSWSTPGPVEMVALGFNETIGDVPSSSWTITINARPYAPFAVIVPASSSTQPAPTATLDSGSSTLTTTVSSTATSISVTTSNPGDLWTTTNVPFDINVTGERMTVTAVSGSTSPQTFTVTRSVNSIVKAQTAGAAIDVFYQDVLGVVST
jgi:hypothetical protein